MRGDLFEEVVGVLLAAGSAGFGVEVLYGFDARVNELDEHEDTVGRDVGSFPELLDLFFREGGVAALGAGGGCERETECKHKQDG